MLYYTMVDEIEESDEVREVDDSERTYVPNLNSVLVSFLRDVGDDDLYLCLKESLLEEDVIVLRVPDGSKSVLSNKLQLIGSRVRFCGVFWDLKVDVAEPDDDCLMMSNPDNIDLSKARSRVESVKLK